jgi:hypothetical protein
MLQLAPVLLRVPDGYWCKFVKDSPNHPVSQLQTVDALQPGVVEPTKLLTLPGKNNDHRRHAMPSTTASCLTCA